MAALPGRVYFSERLFSAAGYLCLPILFDALSYYLPPFRRVSSRIVAIGTRAWELWSPNSSAIAFYPGLRDNAYTFGLDEPECFRRCDGHRGRFDPTVSPQVLDAKRLWYPFVRRVADLGSYPEFTPFLDIWDPPSASIKPSFIERLRDRVSTISQGVDVWRSLAASHPDLWEARPTRPQVEDVCHLSSLHQFAAALDLYMRIQRDAKLTSAWCRMAQALSYDGSYSTELIAAANDSLMGAWINGSSEEVGRWLLKIGVPCFIIHELDSEIDWHNARNAPRRSSFVIGTPVADLIATKNPVDITVIANGGRLTDLFKDRWMAAAPPSSLWEDRVRSSSYGQGWRDEKYAPLVREGAATPFKEADGYILPPAVTPIGSGGGRWTNWEEDETLEGDYCITRINRELAKHVDGKVYYDRENRRAIAFDSTIRPPRDYLADPAIFGLPAPVVLYQEETREGEFRACKALVWLYKKRDPIRGDIGREFRPPARDLITKPEDRMDVDDIPTKDKRSLLETSPRRSPAPARSPSPRQPRQSLPPPCRPYSPRPIPSRPFSFRRSDSPKRQWSDGRATSQRNYQERDSRSRSPDRPSHWRDRSPPRPYSGRHSRRSPSPRVSRHIHSRSPSVNWHRAPSRSRHYSPGLRSCSRSPDSISRTPSPRRKLACSPSPIRDIPMETGKDGLAVVRSSGVTRADFTRLEVLFPSPPPPSFPILDLISPNGQSNILAISNLPVYFLWVDVLVWLRSVLPLVKRPKVKRVLRSIEKGCQVFWIVLVSISEAATLRGLLSARRVPESPALRVDFVHGDVYSERASKFRDAWSPRFGMELENKPDTRRSLADRLGLVDIADRPSSMSPVVDPFPSYDILDQGYATESGPCQPVLQNPPVASSSRVSPPVMPSSAPLPLAQRLGSIVLPKPRRRRKPKRRSGLDPADGGL